MKEIACGALSSHVENTRPKTIFISNIPGYVRSPEQKDYKMQRCLTRIISIESESRQGSGDGGVPVRRGRPDESASHVADLERAKDPIAVVRPRVRHLTLHEAVNDSPKRPNQLLLPFSYNKEISKVERV